MINDSYPPSRCEFVTRPATEDSAKRTCWTPAATVDLVNGFRCEAHPPRWEQSYAQYQHATERPGVADSYRRTMIALLGDRITARYADIGEVAA